MQPPMRCCSKAIRTPFGRWRARWRERPGAIVPVHGASREGLAEGSESYPLEWLVRERSVSVNTAAAGGNASLMAIG